MELIILGSGTGTPSPARSSCSFLLDTGEALLLFDFGPGTLRRILEEGFSPQDIDGIFLSHFHLDHTLDLWAYFFATFDESFTRKSPVTLVASAAFAGLHQTMVEAYGKELNPPPELIRAVFPEPLKDEPALHLPLLPGIRAEAGPVDHKPESLAFRIEAQGRSLVYSGDTDYSPDLIGLAQGAEWLILEATRPDHQKLKGHLTPSLAGRLAREAGIRNLILTHLSPHYGSLDPAGPAGKEFQGPVIAARDGLRIEL